jgi:hypothetical protein
VLYLEAILNGAQKPHLPNPLLARIRELHGFRLSNEAKKWYVLNNLGNVQAIKARVAYATNHPLTHKDLDLKDPYSYPILSKNPPEILESIAQVIRDAGEKARSSLADPNCKLFFSTNGMIGFAPENIREGDLVCRFKRTINSRSGEICWYDYPDAIIVVRREHTGRNWNLGQDPRRIQRVTSDWNVTLNPWITTWIGTKDNPIYAHDVLLNRDDTKITMIGRAVSF